MRTISSIIAEVEKETTPAKQAAILKANASAALKKVVGYAMDPEVRWLLPPGEPPYRPLPKSADAEGRLWTDIRLLDYFIASPEGKNITQIKREQIFMNLLESVDPDDAKLLIRVKDRQLKILPAAVKKAFPGISKDWP